MSLLGDISFGRKLLLHSALSSEELLKRLAGRTCEPLRFKVYGASKSYVGHIADGHFALRLQHKYRSGLSPKVLGAVAAQGDGSTVSLHIRVHPLSLIFLFFGLFLMLALAVTLVFLSHVDELIDIIMFVPLIIILLILLLAVLKVQYEIQSIQDNLTELFECK